jgi:hypothetical protein
MHAADHSLGTIYAASEPDVISDIQSQKPTQCNTSQASNAQANVSLLIIIETG